VAKYRNDAVVQLDLELDASSWCLQIGGRNIPWRIVSLLAGDMSGLADT